MIEYPSLTQSEAWGKANELIGNKVIFSQFEGGGSALMIVRDAKRGRYLEIAGGPLIDWTETEAVKTVLTEIKTIAGREKCVFVRMRPMLADTPENRKLFAGLGMKLAPMHLAAEHTVILDLEKTEAELLKEMRRQTRYEVKRAGKLGICVEKDNSEEIFREFHRVQTETAKRQGFVPPDLKTLLAEREAFAENAQIYMAKTGAEDFEQKGVKYEHDTPIAYGLILRDGTGAAYYEAASTELNRHLPGAYALQWQVMRDLKETGVKYYNLWGIAPKNQPNHRYAGVTTFKTGFGGEIVEFLPAHDLILNKMAYLKNFAVETIRKKRRHL